jgi:hypothetical protein
MMKKNRKQVYELKIDDLEKHDVWEFALDEEGEDDQNEATVRPYRRSGKLNPDKGMFVVKAEFVASNGKKYTGYVTPPVQGDSFIGTIQPIIVLPDGQVGFWNGIFALSEDKILKNYKMLGVQNPNELFPVRFQSSVPITTGPVQVTISGFMYLAEEGGEQVIKEKR